VPDGGGLVQTQPARRGMLVRIVRGAAQLRRPLKTFKSSFRAAIGLYFFKESFA